MLRFVSSRIMVGRLALRAVFVLGALAMAGAASAATCRVTETGAAGNNGTTWATAMTLQAALADASICDEVWVKAGTYKPTSGTDRNISFNILPGVAVYGGFAGGETQRSARDPGANPTILSGDIGTSGDSSDNSYHVVFMDGTTGTPITPTTVLDGFTISDGNADGSGIPDNSGGGLYCDAYGGSTYECSPTLSNLIFSGNHADSGGGMLNDAGADAGAQPQNRGGTSSPILSNVTFSGNSADYAGGAMYNAGQAGGTSSPSLSNVTFNGNSARDYGGAIFNSGERGGTACPSLSNVTFSGNSASLYGGAMANLGELDGATCGYRLSNVTFSGNSAHSEGGAMYNLGYGGGTVTPRLSNVIAWGNTAPNGPEIYNEDSATPTIEYSVIQGSGGSSSWDSNLGTDGGGNLDADPLLGPLQNNGGLTQTLLPGAGSSAIDTGNDTTCANAPVGGLDQRGVTRPQGPQCDIGAVEVTPSDLAAPVAVPTLDWRLLLLLAGLLGGFALLRQRRA